MRATIMQPCYIPWLGYFSLIDQADLYVFYDDVQFTKRTWQNRNRIKMPNGNPMWLTIPVIKNFGQPINEVKLNNKIDWCNHHWECIRHAYKNAPYWDKYSGMVEEYYASLPSDNLYEFTENLIMDIARTLGMKYKIYMFSRYIEASREGTKADRLVNILKTIGANEYIAAKGATYLLEKSEFDKFDDAGIKIYWRGFEHPEYTQIYGDFVSHMSILDALFNVGPDTLKLIRRNTHPKPYNYS